MLSSNHASLEVFDKGNKNTFWNVPISHRVTLWEDLGSSSCSFGRRSWKTLSIPVIEVVPKAERLKFTFVSLQKDKTTGTCAGMVWRAGIIILLRADTVYVFRFFFFFFKLFQAVFLSFYFTLFIYICIWLHQVLAAARGLFTAACRLLSTCGTQAPECAGSSCGAGA